MMHRLLVFSLLVFGGIIAGAEEPPRDARLEEKKFEALATRDTSPLSVKALELQPQKWKHGETEHFIIHYRRITEAQKVAREVEFDLWFVARALGASKERYAKKSHIYVFQDEREWNIFRYEAGFLEWMTSVAVGDDLFLHVGGAGEGFDSETLAHETTHAVVARLYPGNRWPRWLNEGFAEYMATASLSARKRVWKQGMQRGLSGATLSPTELVAITNYPEDRKKVHQFYQSSEKLIRFLMNEYPPERFPAFTDAILAGTPFQDALLKTYSDRVKDYPAFLKQYERFTR